MIRLARVMVWLVLIVFLDFIRHFFARSDE